MFGFKFQEFGSGARFWLDPDPKKKVCKRRKEKFVNFLRHFLISSKRASKLQEKPPAI
jgi:hypothetical protein